MEYGKDVLKSLVPTQRLDLDQNDSYSLYVPPKSPLSESIPAMLGISYGSMLFEVENYSNYSEKAYNEPSSVMAFGSKLQAVESVHPEP